MKFRYEYRTSDNKLHEGFITAKNRDAVFAALAKEGRRPSRVVQLADPLHWVKVGVGGVLGLAILASAVLYAVDRARTVRPETRRQIYGDPVLIERGVASDWTEVLPDATDRYLARYAQPGWRVRIVADGSARAAIAADLAAQAAKKMRFASDDLMEHRQLKGMIAALRAEAAEFIAAGGDARRYLELLDERQQSEAEIRAQGLAAFQKAIEAKLPPDRLSEYWMDCNRKLKSLGLKPIPMPETLAD